MERFRQKSKEKLEKVAHKTTRWIGSTSSLTVHTILFIVAFLLYFLGISFDKILLVVTTIVSLEAIYLSIFIQMSVNRHAKELEAVAEDVEDIQEDVEDIQEDVDEIQKDVDEIQEDVEDIQEDVDEIQEDVEDIQEDDEKEDEEDKVLLRIEDTLGRLIEEVYELKKQHHDVNKK